jgi:glutathionylspermidine synthase
MNDNYVDFAAKIVDSNVLRDPWVDGAPRFREAPLLLSNREASELARTAEAIGALYNELVQRVLDPSNTALDRFFCLSPAQRAMLTLGGPAWHGIGRVDLFQTAAGLVTSELNSDTPTGQAEAVVLSALCATAALHDPNKHFETAFGAMVNAVTTAALGPAHPMVAAIIYPTEFTEDLPLVRLYRQWLERLGYEVVLGSPFNLTVGPSRRVALFGKEISLLWRHYKTDWWGERESAFDDEDIPERAPLDRELAVVAACAAGTVVLNPFSSVLPQNKRSMAYFWEHIAQFSTAAQRTIGAHVPPTFRLEIRDPRALLAEKDQWVLKSDYGAEGDEVIVGKLVSAELFRETIAHARKGRWIAQRYFEVTKAEDGLLANLGVFLCAGRACGIYGRLDQGLTDARALSAAVLIDRSR